MLISALFQSISLLSVVFTHNRVLLCSRLFVVTDGRPLLCFVGRRRGGGGARRGLSNHRILPLPHPAVSSLQGKRLPWPLIIDFPLSFWSFSFIFVFSHWFIWVRFRFVINTHNTSERNPKKDANANKHLADDNWSRLAVSTSHKNCCKHKGAGVKHTTCASAVLCASHKHTHTLVDWFSRLHW